MITYSEWVSAEGLTSPSTHYVISEAGLSSQSLVLLLTTYKEQPNEKTRKRINNNTTLKESIVNSTSYILQRNLGEETGQMEPRLVVFYDIRPGNAAGPFLTAPQPARGYLCI